MIKLRLLATIMVCFLIANDATAQSPTDSRSETDSLRVVVSRVQARGIYVDVSDAQWERGDTLMVLQNEDTRALSRVAGKSSTSLLLVWLLDPLSLEVGNELVLVGPRKEHGPEQDLDLAEERRSILGRPVGVRTDPRSSGVQVHGYYSASLTASVSEVKGQFTDTRSSSRQYMNPVSSLRMRVEGLPGSGRFMFSARGSRRFSSQDLVSRSGSFRMYELKYQSQISSGLSLEAGRFRERHTPAGGYWDGLNVSFKTGDFLFGVSGGFEPDRYSEAFQTDINKISVFSDVSKKHTGGSTSLMTAFTRIDGSRMLRPYSFISIEQKSRLGRTRLSTSLQIDESPIDGKWDVSRFYVRASSPISETLRLSGRYGSRQYFPYWRTDASYSARKNQTSAGITWQKRTHLVGLTVSSNSFSGSEKSNSVTASFRTQPGWMPFRISNSTSVFERPGGRTLYSSTSFQKELRRLTLGLEYSLLAVDQLGPLALSHIAGASVRFRMDKWGYLSIRQRAHLSSSVTSSTFFINYGISF